MGGLNKSSLQQTYYTILEQYQQSRSIRWYLAKSYNNKDHVNASFYHFTFSDSQIAKY